MGSIIYRHANQIKKLGGWKFPVYDMGGENWLGVQTIQHTIEAAEGFVPMSKLAHNVLAKFNGKIEKITETCFKGSGEQDIYCLFTDILLRNYLAKDSTAVSIIEDGFQKIKRLIDRADSVIGTKAKITLTGSLVDIYQDSFDQTRLTTSPSNKDKVNLLADIDTTYLTQHGVELVS